MEARYLWGLVVLAALPAARGIWLDLGSNSAKCVSEELQNNVVVMGTYYSFYGQNDDNVNDTITVLPYITVRVSSPHGNNLHRQEKVRYGHFGFTTNEPGSYTTCFWVDSGDHQAGKNVTVGLDWKTGIATKDWDSIAKKEKIEGLDLELRKLEDAVEHIKKTLRTMMTKEMHMRDVSEETNARVAHYSILSLGLCVVVSVVQVLYLRRYFQKKKLI